MGYLENLPSELLIPITSHLGQQDCLALRATARRFGFLAPRVFTRMFIEAGQVIPWKLRDFLTRADLRPFLKELVLDARPSLRYRHELMLKTVFDTWREMAELLASYPDVSIRKIQIVGEWCQLDSVLDCFAGTGIESILCVATWTDSCYHDEPFDIYPRTLSTFYQGLKSLDLRNENRSLCDDFYDIIYEARFLEELHLGSPKVAYGTAVDFDRPWTGNTLRKVTFSRCKICRDMECLQAIMTPALEELTLLEMNLVGSLLSFPVLDPGSGMYDWQTFAQAFDDMYSDSDTPKRLILGGLMEEEMSVTMDVSNLRCVTLLDSTDVAARLAFIDEMSPWTR